MKIVVGKLLLFQVLRNRFKEANLYTEQFVTFTNQMEFQVSSSPTIGWKIKSINSHVVSQNTSTYSVM